MAEKFPRHERRETHSKGYSKHKQWEHNEGILALFFFPLFLFADFFASLFE